MIDLVAREPCEFCKGTRRQIGALKGQLLVQCEGCGVISTTLNTQIIGSGKKIKTLRKHKNKKRLSKIDFKRKNI